MRRNAGFIIFMPGAVAGILIAPEGFQPWALPFALLAAYIDVRYLR